MIDGYYLSTSPPLYSRKTQEKLKRKPRKPQEKLKGISLILESLQYTDYHNSYIYKFLFIQRIFRHISVIFPKNLRSISRRISTSYNHGMVLFSG